jgi:hypothetical protein
MMEILRNLAATISINGKDYEAEVPVVTGTGLMSNGLNIVYFVLGIVAVVVIILAGYQYLTANGEAQKAAKAMQTILFAVIGLVVVIMAFAITNFVLERV